jgi:hypothetical protein
VLHEIGADPNALNASMREWWVTVVKGVKVGFSLFRFHPSAVTCSPCTQDNATLAKEERPWIDVRDLALAHRLALEKPDAGGERIIICAGTSKWQDWRA